MFQKCIIIGGKECGWPRWSVLDVEMKALNNVRLPRICPPRLVPDRYNGLDWAVFKHMLEEQCPSRYQRVLICHLISSGSMHVNEAPIDNRSCGGLCARGKDVVDNDPRIIYILQENMRAIELENSNASRV